MSGNFFVLLRYFLRVDKVKIKIHDTRYYFEVRFDFIEFTKIRITNRTNSISLNIGLKL